MADTVDLSVLSAAPVTFVAPGSRKEKTVLVDFVVDISVASLGVGEAPLAFRANDHALVFECRLFDGQLVQPHHRHDVEKMRTEFAEGHYVGDYLLDGKWPFEDVRKQGEVPAGARIVSDRRHEMESMLRAGARSMCFIDGKAWSACSAPGLCLEWGGSGNARVKVSRSDRPEYSFYGFSVDREDVLREFTAANQGAGGFKRVSWLTGVQHHGVEVLAYPEAIENARCAVRLALWSVKDSLPTLSPGMLERLADIARVRDGLNAGAATPADAEAALAALEAERASQKRHVNLMHTIRIGREAIARSLPEVRGGFAKFDAEDASAFEGLAAA